MILDIIHNELIFSFIHLLLISVQNVFFPFHITIITSNIKATYSKEYYKFSEVIWGEMVGIFSYHHDTKTTCFVPWLVKTTTNEPHDK